MCHGVAEVVVSQGRVVVEAGKVNVVRGCGRFIPRKPFSDLVYSRILQRDKVSHHSHTNKERSTPLHAGVPAPEGGEGAVHRPRYPTALTVDLTTATGFAGLHCCPEYLMCKLCMHLLSDLGITPHLAVLYCVNCWGVINAVIENAFLAEQSESQKVQRSWLVIQCGGLEAMLVWCPVLLPW